MTLLVPLLTHTVAVHRKSSARDTSGGAVESYAVVTGLEAVACLVQSTSGKAPRQLGQRQVLATHAVYFAEDPGWVRGDRLYWNEGGLYFTVHNTSDMGGQARVWRVDCVLVEA